MGHIRSEFDELDTLCFSDFKSQKPKNVRAVRSGDTIYFIDENKEIYTSRIIRREKYSFPLSLYDDHLIKILEKLGFITAIRRDEILKRMSELLLKKNIKEAEEDLKSAQKRLKELKAKK